MLPASRLKELPPSGGVSVLATSESLDAELVRDSIELLRALEWEGVAMVEFRVSPTRGAYLMEVNGRYWGTVGLPVSAGTDFPLYQWQILHGERPAVKPPADMIRWRWTAGYVRRLRGLLGAAVKGGSIVRVVSRVLVLWRLRWKNEGILSDLFRSRSGHPRCGGNDKGSIATDDPPCTDPMDIRTS